MVFEFNVQRLLISRTVSTAALWLERLRYVSVHRGLGRTRDMPHWLCLALSSNTAPRLKAPLSVTVLVNLRAMQVR